MRWATDEHEYPNWLNERQLLNGKATGRAVDVKQA
jgi:hypothetical protein